MNKEEGNLIALFTKSNNEAIGIGLSEWKGTWRVDIRTYVQAIGEDSLVPTPKGVSIKIEDYGKLLDGVKKLGDVMSNEKVVAQFPKSNRDEIRIGINTYKGSSLIYIRQYYQNKEDSEWYPTQKGISLKVDMYSKLLEAIEALAPEIRKLDMATT